MVIREEAMANEDEAVLVGGERQRGEGREWEPTG